MRKNKDLYSERIYNKTGGNQRMEKKIIYPAPERIVEYNVLVLNIIKVKKADKPEVLSYQRIVDTIEGCKGLEGDIYDKTIFLLKNLIQKHPFASGNRRTAFIVTKEFLLNNQIRFKIKDNPKYAGVMQGIRENYYTDLEIKEWIKNDKIKEFEK